MRSPPRPRRDRTVPAPGDRRSVAARPAPLENLYDHTAGPDLPLPRALARPYGPFRLPRGVHGPYVVGNFASTLDGVVSLQSPGASSGGEITGFDPRDRLLMGILRAAADAVVVGAGTLRAVPRHVWTDPLMLELADRWARAMAAGFANHPAIDAWDLGDDPAGIIRPRRIADLATWVRLVGDPLREQGDRVHLTLGADDILRGRGVRLGAVAPHLDRIDVAVRPSHLRRLGLAEPSALRFLAQLAQALAGESRVPIGLALAAPSPDGDAEGIEEVAAAAAIDELLERRAEAGICGLRATRWCDLHRRLAERAPYDRSGWLLRSGLIRLDGTERPALDIYARAARAGLDAAEPHPWPARLDVDAYYANLPDSLLDVAAGWRREHDDEPAILDGSEV